MTLHYTLHYSPPGVRLPAADAPPRVVRPHLTWFYTAIVLTLTTFHLVLYLARVLAVGRRASASTARASGASRPDLLPRPTHGGAR